MPKRIFKTNDQWGNVNEYHDEEGMQSVIESLQSLGEDWENIAITDCTIFQKEIDISANTAEYYGEKQFITLEKQAYGYKRID